MVVYTSTSIIIILHLSASVWPYVDVSVSEEPVYLTTFNMTCKGSLISKVASQLIQYMILDWVMEDGQSVSQTDGVTIEEQRIFPYTTIRSLIFDPLNITHGATYKCQATMILPNSAGSFNTSLLYPLSVLSML